MQLSSIDDLQTAKALFFSLEIPILILISAIALYFASWTYKGIIRRFNNENGQLFLPRGAVLFLIGYIVLVTGLFINYFRLGDSIAYFYWIVTLLPVFILPMASLKNFDDYFEFAAFVKDTHFLKLNSLLTLLKFSNISLCLVLFGIWAICAAISNPPENFTGIHNIVTIFTFFMSLVLLLEIYALFKNAAKNLVVLLVFIVAAYMILPMILSGLFMNELLSLYSPVGFLVSIFDEKFSEPSVKNTVIVMNLLLSIVPAIVIYNKYKYIIKQRKTETATQVLH